MILSGASNIQSPGREEFRACLGQPATFSRLESMALKAVRAARHDAALEEEGVVWDYGPKIARKADMLRLAPAVFDEVHRLLDWPERPSPPGLAFVTEETLFEMANDGLSDLFPMRAYSYRVQSAVMHAREGALRLVTGAVGLALPGRANEKLAELLDSASGSYCPIDRRITMDVRPEVKFSATLAHEYAHHLQETYWPTDLSRNPGVTEGHAIGVARLFSRSGVGDNPAHGVYARDLDARLLGAAYLMCAGEAGGEPLPEIAEFPRLLLNVPDHALGWAFFCLAEEQYGPGIYRRALSRDFTPAQD